MFSKLQLISIYWAFVVATSLDVIDTVMEDIVTNLKKFKDWREVRYIKRNTHYMAQIKLLTQMCQDLLKRH